MTTERSALSPSEGPTESNITNATTATNKPSAKPGVVKKKGAKPKMTAKEKRERGLEIERILAALPLEFRGDDPNLRRHIEQVLEKFLDNPGESFNSTLPPSLFVSQRHVTWRLCSYCVRQAPRFEPGEGEQVSHRVSESQDREER